MSEPPAEVVAFLREHPSLRLEPGALKVGGGIGTPRPPPGTPAARPP